MPHPLPAPLTLQHVLFAAQLVTTLALFGLIWFVQIVHYPLFLRVPPEVSVVYESEHAHRTGWVAAPLMVIELLSALLFLDHNLRPAQIPTGESCFGAVLVLVLWASTFFLQVPLHDRLHRGFNRNAIQKLVSTNWLRTAAWTARAALITHWTLRLLSPN